MSKTCGMKVVSDIGKQKSAYQRPIAVFREVCYRYNIIKVDHMIRLHPKEDLFEFFGIIKI